MLGVSFLLLFLFSVIFCAILVVLLVSERRASACLIMLSAKQGSHWFHFLTPLVWRDQGSNPRPPAPEADALPFALSGPVKDSLIAHMHRTFIKAVGCVTGVIRVFMLKNISYRQ